MKAAVYSKVSEAGIDLVDVSYPSLNDMYPPKNKFPVLISLFISSFFTIFALFMRVLRSLISWIPGAYISVYHLLLILNIYLYYLLIGPYGHNPHRKFVLIKVKYAGVNPVDSKWLYGDKLPHFFLPIVQLFLNGRICGIDFSGTVVDAMPNSGFKVVLYLFTLACINLKR